MTKVTVEIENTYPNRASKHSVVLDAPPVGVDFEVELPGWFEDKVWEHTGDGTGEYEPAHYLATIIEAPGREDLVGQWFEWV